MDFDVDHDIRETSVDIPADSNCRMIRHFGAGGDKKALKVARVKGRYREMIKVSDDFYIDDRHAHNAMALESLLDTLKSYRIRKNP